MATSGRRSRASASASTAPQAVPTGLQVRLAREQRFDARTNRGVVVNHQHASGLRRDAAIYPHAPAGSSDDDPGTMVVSARSMAVRRDSSRDGLTPSTSAISAGAMP